MVAEEINLIRTPINTNLIQPNRFFFVIPNLPFANYFGQTVNIPGISTSAADHETPFVNMPVYGDKLVYEPLRISFLVDEDLRVWEETYGWLKGLTKPHGFQEYQEQKRKGLFWDGILGFNTNSHINNIRLRFTYCFPISLSGFTLTFTEDAETQITADLTLVYETYIFERINQT